MARSHTVELGWEHPDTGEAFRVTCDVRYGTPRPRLLTPESSWVPGDDEDVVEAIRVVEDRPGGVDRPELLDVVREFLATGCLLHFDAVERAREGEGRAPLHDTVEEARLER